MQAVGWSDGYDEVSELGRGNPAVFAPVYSIYSGSAWGEARTLCKSSLLPVNSDLAPIAARVHSETSPFTCISEE